MIDCIENTGTLVQEVQKVISLREQFENVINMVEKKVNAIGFSTAMNVEEDDNKSTSPLPANSSQLDKLKDANDKLFISLERLMVVDSRLSELINI